jgi:hypothetical protein
MKYNTETLNRAAEQLAEMFKVAISEGTKSATIADIEKGMREALRQIGIQALGQLLSSLQTTPESEIDCECGGTLKYQRMRTATVISVFGRVTYERAYYAGCKCGKGKSPLDGRFGLEPGSVTSGLAALLALAGIAFSYDESPKWLDEYLLFEVSENTVRSETEQIGELQQQQEETLIKQSQEETFQQDRQRHPGKIVQRLYGSMDAAKVRIEPRPKKGEEKPEHDDWRDMKIVCWYEAEAVPLTQRSTRQREKAERELPVLRAKNMRYWCDIIEAEAFGKLLWATGCMVNADLSPELVFLGDGAVWIWKLVSHYYRNAVQIVDWFHAEEHLEIVAKAAFSNEADQNAWIESASQSLWDGNVEDVILACEALAASCTKAQEAVIYFSNNIERMRYDKFRAAGYLTGSGTIESACKQIVTQRLKLPGAQWEVTGAVQTAKARAAWLSGSWQSLCNLRSALPLAI